MSFVDVPGHVRFLANMLAGVGGVVACLFVVDALEGWKPQSEEHLRILELVGVAHGVVALTKVDRADSDLVALARLELADRLTGSFLADAEVVDVAAPRRQGLDELRAALGRTLRAAPAVADTDRPRLWVDRAFAARGAGTIVTGTLLGGAVAVDDQLAVRPGGPTIRVRGIQAHHAAVGRVPPGSRTALNLVGVEHDAVGRGQVVVRADQWHETTVVDATLQVLAGLGHRVTRRGAYMAHLGTAEEAVRLRVLGADGIEPGAAGLVRLHLATALPLVPGDRFVLRESGRGETVGGGEILDVDPVLPATRARPDRSVDRIVAERGWVEVDELERLTGERRPADIGTWVVDPDALETARAALAERIGAAGELGLDVARLDDRERAVIDTLTDIGGRGRPGAGRRRRRPAGRPPVRGRTGRRPVRPTAAGWGRPGRAPRAGPSRPGRAGGRDLVRGVGDRRGRCGRRRTAGGSARRVHDERSAGGAGHKSEVRRPPGHPARRPGRHPPP